VRLGTPSLTGRIAPPTNLDRSFTKVEFENTDVKIVRFLCAARGKCEIASPSGPALEVVFSESPEKSQVRWVSDDSRPATNAVVHLIRIEFKKQMVSPEELAPKPIH
jgi:hypothetical protein